MSIFDPSVLAPDPRRRRIVLDWLERALVAVDAEQATAAALGSEKGPCTVVAIGKAAAGMARGAAQVLDIASGVCVSDHAEPVPCPMVGLTGDHPVPGPASMQAGKEVLATVRQAPPGRPIIGLISGGGSALCELPLPGVPFEYLAEVNRRLLQGGAAIDEMNLARAHLSSIKGGGLARAAGRPIDTYVISDVAGGDPALVASGPTVPHRHSPEEAKEVLIRHGIAPDDEVWRAMQRAPDPLPRGKVVLVADGRVAAEAIASAARPARVSSTWLHGPVEAAVARFIREAAPGVSVLVGEPLVAVRGEGRGGRCTHAALLAAIRIAGSDDVFVAFATDGVDGCSGAAGAIVDGTTLERGGDPDPALASFDAGGYLARSGDLLHCGPTGTNVSDLWILWRRAGSSVVE